MADLAKRLKANKSCSSLLVLFVPSADRNEEEIDQDYWVDQALEFLGSTFGGATAYPRAKGVWRDDRRSGQLVHDQPVVIPCYTSEEAIEEHASKIGAFMRRMGKRTNQGAVGIVIDRDYLEIILD